jgi:subfamily B ATP-binding cassette protein MsbA
LQQAIVAGKSVFDLIDEMPEDNSGSKPMNTISGDIKFDRS